MPFLEVIVAHLSGCQMVYCANFVLLKLKLLNEKNKDLMLVFWWRWYFGTWWTVGTLSMAFKIIRGGGA